MEKGGKEHFFFFFLHLVNSAHSIKYLHHGKKYPHQTLTVIILTKEGKKRGLY